ncbi:hypothetical protein GS458_0348 [Geobacillus stearothermophilus]|nr:hypothetical protein GS458_0348 [Geobacillus stearothermophilus]
MKVLRNKGEFCTQVYEKPFCTQEPHDFSRWEIQVSYTYFTYLLRIHSISMSKV